MDWQTYEWIDIVFRNKYYLTLTLKVYSLSITYLQSCQAFS